MCVIISWAVELVIPDVSSERMYLVQDNVIYSPTEFLRFGLNPFNSSDQSNRLMALILM